MAKEVPKGKGVAGEKGRIERKFTQTDSNTWRGVLKKVTYGGNGHPFFPVGSAGGARKETCEKPRAPEVRERWGNC